MSPFEGQIASPFVDSARFEAESNAYIPQLGRSTPFVETWFEDAHDSADSNGARHRLLVAELHDEEMDDAIYELMGEVGATPHMGTGSLQLQFSPFLNEVDAAIDRVSEAYGSRPLSSLSDAEIDDAVSRMRPDRQLAPAFENLFGKITGAIGKTLKKGVAVVGSLALKQFMGPIKKLLGKFVKGVIDAAAHRLPKSLQPLAQSLKNKLGPAVTSEIDGEESEAPSVDVSGLQREFNEQVADLLLGESPAELEDESSVWSAVASPAPGIAELDAARDRFIAELSQLEDGEDPSPAVERFLPALLPILKMGIRIIGKKKVEKTIAKLVSGLISRFIGPAQAGALSTALVDAGMKLMGLEVSDADLRSTAHASIAATVEETIRRVAALPESVLENESLLEGSVVRAFERSAAANLPRLFPDAVYRRRPDLAETDTLRGAWIPFPVRGPKRCKKFSRVVRTRITPRMAMAIPIFGGVPLSYYLQEQLGLEPGEELEADVHLYESLPGTVLGEVARFEANGNGSVSGAVEFHPLTAEAAGLLLKEPGLGQSRGVATSPQRLAVGQRFYRIAVPDRRVNVMPAPGTRRQPRRRTTVSTVLDFRGDRIVVNLFLAERRAQELAASLRKQGHGGAVAASLASFIDRGVAGAANGNVTGRVRIVHEALQLDEARGAALRRVPADDLRRFASRIGEWTLGAVSDFLTKQSARFISATEDAQDGVTVVVTLSNPPGMAAMRQAVAGKPPAADAGAQGKPSAVTVEVVPGFKNA
jgi:hypothetical protein